MTEVKEKIKVKVFRFNPQKDKEPLYETYEVPFEQYMTVLTALNYIYENIDSSLAYNYSCKEGLCHACDVVVNGKAVEACSTLVRGDITVEPPWQQGFKVIKDLIATDVLLSERDLRQLAGEHAVDSVKSIAESPSLNHAVIRFLKTVKGKNFSEEDIARDLGIPVNKVKEILKQLQSHER